MNVPLIKPDLPRLQEIQGALEEVLSNGRITNFGRYVSEFETEVGARLGANAITVSSGTLGLVLSLQALGLEPGQKVILPSFTFMATAQAVLYAGCIPVFAEIGEDLTVSPADVEDLLRNDPDICAVVAVHTFGLPAQAQALENVVATISQESGRRIHLLFDAAHAFGSAVNGRSVGSFGDAEVFSLSVTKVLVTVEGGLILTRRPDLIDRIRSMRNYGIACNYDAHFAGMNGKMSELHAIIGLNNLRRIDDLIASRQAKARRFRCAIHEGTRFRVTSWPDGVTHVWKDFTVLMPADGDPDLRNRVSAFLAKHAVETRAYFYPPVHEQHHFRRFASRRLPVTERLSRRVLTLPFYTSMRDDEMDYVVERLQDAERALL
jgi:dTDP-4-amino-4,6-dideoxygalactose transaminase